VAAVKLESLFDRGLRRQWILILHSRVAVGSHVAW